jgi:uncharacterized protein YbgA (DUF1722 family)
MKIFKRKNEDLSSENMVADGVILYILNVLPAEEVADRELVSLINSYRSGATKLSSAQTIAKQHFAVFFNEILEFNRMIYGEQADLFFMDFWLRSRAA